MFTPSDAAQFPRRRLHREGQAIGRERKKAGIKIVSPHTNTSINNQLPCKHRALITSLAALLYQDKLKSDHDLARRYSEDITEGATFCVHAAAGPPQGSAYGSWRLGGGRGSVIAVKGEKVNGVVEVIPHDPAAVRGAGHACDCVVVIVRVTHRWGVHGHGLRACARTCLLKKHL